MDYYSLLRPLIFTLAAETAHNAAIGALKHGLLPKQRLRPAPALAQTVWGLEFPHPVGLAAGFDKNAEALHGLAAQGFAFVEAGTVTPRPQPGNPSPRLFRLVEDAAVINRFGFNNEGLAPFIGRMHARPRQVIVGANIGKNKDSDDAVADYVQGLRALHAAADYITVNISSPNTAGLRSLQAADALHALLGALSKARAELGANSQPNPPLLLKIAPDLTDDERAAVAEVVRANAVDGVIISNTTVARPASLQGRHAGETGGLSGAPLMEASTEGLRQFYRITEGTIPLVGVGGVTSAADAYAKICAGASLVQLYSALVYQGFGLVRAIVEELPALLARDGHADVRSAIGSKAA